MFLTVVVAVVVVSFLPENFGFLTPYADMAGIGPVNKALGNINNYFLKSLHPVHKK